MKSFFTSFFAALTALVIFSIIALVIIFGIIGIAASPSKTKIASDAILVIDLSTEFNEQSRENQIADFFGNETADIPGLYDLMRLIHHAKTDSAVKGIYLKVSENPNGFATSEELRAALNDFKQSKKFIIAYGPVISQKAYYVGTVANKIYCNPQGGLEWDGFSVNLMFMKGLLDKLEIEPEVFYAGKFKSATEPFRFTKMSDPNREQTSIWLNELYGNFLTITAASRKLDTATLHSYANSGAIQTANDAVRLGLIDGLKYDDQIKDMLAKLVHKNSSDDLNFVSIGKYAAAVNFRERGGNDKIAIIYAQGDIVDGEGEQGQVGSEDFIKIIRSASMDDDIKAIVFRVNSPGGSSLASEAIWREITLAKGQKPVVVSMGDYAASGGYYISCAADSIFADAGTITGSIGVFSILPNMQQFFDHKGGITFDGVKTAPYADMGSVSRPLSAMEKHFLQNSVDSIYLTFKTRVADGRAMNINFVDSIAQGHVWTGKHGITIGIVDRIGTIKDAVFCAAKLAKTSSYGVAEFPKKKSLLEQLSENPFSVSAKTKAVKEQIGEEQYEILMQSKRIKAMLGIPQTRLPFEYDIH